jgi:hypothetical protein
LISANQSTADDLVRMHCIELAAEVASLRDSVLEAFQSSSSSSSSSMTMSSSGGGARRIGSRDQEEAELQSFVEQLANDDEVFSAFESDCVMFVRERERLSAVRSAAIEGGKIAAARLGHGFETNYSRIITSVTEIAQIGRPPRDLRADRLAQENARLRRALAKREGGAVNQRHVERWIEDHPHWLEAALAKKMSSGAPGFGHGGHHGHGSGGQHAHHHPGAIVPLYGSPGYPQAAAKTAPLKGSSATPLLKGSGATTPAAAMPVRSATSPNSSAHIGAGAAGGGGGDGGGGGGGGGPLSPSRSGARLGQTSSPLPPVSARRATADGEALGTTSSPRAGGGGDGGGGAVCTDVVAAAAAAPGTVGVDLSTPDRSENDRSENDRSTPDLIKRASPTGAQTIRRSKSNLSVARREVIMQMASAVFASSLDTPRLIHTIMESARTLVDADRCSLFLVDEDSNELYTTISGCDEEVRLPLSSGIAGHVASTGETLNVVDVYSDPRFNK